MILAGGSVQLPKEFCEKNISAVRCEEVGHCPVCDHAHFKVFSSGFDYELQTCSNLWYFVECESCSHVWLNPRPVVDELPTIYPPTYYAYNYDQQINKVAIYGKAILDQQKLKKIFKLAKPDIQTFLDIGCGNGRFLRAANSYGVSRSKIFGIELDALVVKKLREEGFRVFCERVENCRSIENRSIDLATMFHVIEHLENPLDVICKIRDWLSPKGIVAIETPNLESIDAKLFKETFWGGYHIPRHWNLFTPRTIENLLSRAGFRVISVSFQTGHSFWMYSFHHLLRYGTLANRKFAKLFDPFSSLPLLVLFTAFDKLRAAVGCKTSSMLVVAKRES